MLHLGLRAAYPPTRLVRRLASTPVCSFPQPVSPQPTPKNKQRKTDKDALYDMEVEDFRPPWVYTTTKLMNYLLMPGIFFYSMFIYDWGPGDHVFQVPRRWLQAQKEAFFALTPDEQKLVRAKSNSETNSETKTNT